MVFKYRGDTRTVEDVLRRARNRGGMYDSIISPELPLYKAKEGEGRIRILPATWDDQKTWGNGWQIEAIVHYNVGNDRGNYLCLDAMRKERCPVCEARFRTRDPAEKEAYKQSRRALCWIIDRNNERAGPQIFNMAQVLASDIDKRSVSKKDNSLFRIDHPEKGNDVMYNREGSDKKTKWTQVEVEQEQTPVHADPRRMKQWLDYIEEYPLPEQLNFYEAEYIEKVLFGAEDSSTSDAAEEPVDTPRRGRAAAAEEEVSKWRRPSRDEPVEEEEELPRTRRVATAEPEPEDYADETYADPGAYQEPEDETEAEQDAAEEEEFESVQRRPTRRVPEPEEPVQRRTARRVVDEDPPRKAPPPASAPRRRVSEESPSSQAKRSLGRLQERR